MDYEPVVAGMSAGRQLLYLPFGAATTCAARSAHALPTSTTGNQFIPPPLRAHQLHLACGQVIRLVSLGMFGRAGTQLGQFA